MYYFLAGAEDFECNEEVNLSSNEDLENLRLGIEIFPNPTSGMITVVFPEEAKQGILKILNNMGQLFSAFSIEQVSDKYQLDFSSFSSGIYHLQYLSERSKIYNAKVIVR